MLLLLCGNCLLTRFPLPRKMLLHGNGLQHLTGGKHERPQCRTQSALYFPGWKHLPRYVDLLRHPARRVGRQALPIFAGGTHSRSGSTECRRSQLYRGQRPAGRSVPALRQTATRESGSLAGHGQRKFPEELLSLRLFKCRQWFWLVVPGLRDGEPTRISPNGARLPEEQPSTKPDSDPSEWN